MKTCHACKRELTPGRTIGRREECPFCRADLRCCRNCRLYDRAASKQCREPMAELVKTKERANSCEYFTFRDSGAADAQGGDADRSRKALDDLFKK